MSQLHCNLSVKLIAQLAGIVDGFLPEASKLRFTVFRDPITKQQKISIFVILAGIVILAVLSS